MFSKILEPINAQLERLNERERVLVVGGGAGAILLIFTIVGVLISNAIGAAERRVILKTAQLAEVIQLEGEYKARERERQAKLRELERSNVRLIAVVEDAARTAGIEIGQIRPEEGEPNEEGVVESTVDLRASDLSVDRLQKFLETVENTPGLVVVRRLQVSKPYRRDTLNIELTVSTYKVKKS